MKATVNSGNPHIAVRGNSGQALGVAGTIAVFAAVLAVGVLLGAKELMGGMMPLGIAYCAAVPGIWSPAAAAGVVLGAVSGAPAGLLSRYAAAAIISAVTKPVIMRIIKPRTDRAVSAGCAAFSVLAGGTLGIILSQDVSGGALFMLLCECMMSGCFACFFCSCAHPLQNKLKTGCLSNAELTSLTVSFSALLAAMSGLEIYGISPARIAAVTVILAAGRWGGEAAGVIAGTAAGVAMALGGGQELVYLAGAYALGGLAAGIFSRFTRAGSAAAFIVGNGLFSLMASGDELALITLYEVFAATVIFMLLPTRAAEKLCGFFAPRSEPARMTSLRSSLTGRLTHASQALSDVSSTVEKVAQRLDERGSRSMDGVFDRTKKAVCRFCALHTYCWEGARAETSRELTAAAVRIRSGKTAPREIISREMAARCTKPEELARTLGAEIAEYTASENAVRRVREIRGAVSDQLGAVASLLGSVADDLEQVERYDDESAARAEEVVRAEKILPSSVGCRVDAGGRMTLEITAASVLGGVFSRSSLASSLSTALDRDFATPSVVKSGETTVITLSERTSLRLDTGISQYSYKNNPLCGDACCTFTDGRGREILLISDGMGCGGRAAVDGAMVSGLMSRLIKAGFGFDCALSVVNSAMLFKSEDESLATVDAACFDLFTGRCDFFKAGSPSSIVRKGGRIGRAECSSFPAGILREVSFDRSECTFSAGDIIVMVSDGLTFDGDAWIGEELLRFGSGTAKQLADRLIHSAHERRNDGREDDMTVIAAIVESAF